MAENPRGDRQVVGGRVELPRGIDTPGVESYPWGDKTYRVTLEGDGVPEEVRRGQVGDEKSPPT